MSIKHTPGRNGYLSSVAMLFSTLLASCGGGGGDGAQPNVTTPSLANINAQTLGARQNITISFVNGGGGELTGCAVRPALPTGLSIGRSSDGSTCVIRGMASTISAQTTYTVTATNATGVGSALVKIAIIPTLLSMIDGGAQTFTIGRSVSINLIDNSGGTIANCSVVPDLPPGLSIEVSTDSATCEITGTPVEARGQTTYTVTATGATGSHNASVEITVNPTAPLLSGAEGQTYTAGATIPDLVFTNNGGGLLTACIVEPDLPPGLSIELSTDGATCEITGAPVAGSILATYTVTATNATGDGNASVDIAVTPTAPSLTGAEAQTYTVDVAIDDLRITNDGGGLLTDCGVHPDLPSGLIIGRSFDNSICEITGTPTTVGERIDYAITATNDGGSDSVNITITVAVIATALFLPDSVSVTNNRAQLTWMSRLNAIYYEVWRANVGDGEPISRLQTNVSATSYTDTTFSPDTDYYYLIAECTPLGCVDPSNSGPRAIASVQDDLLDGAIDVATAFIDNRFYAVVAALNDNGIQIIDIADLDSLREVSSLKDNSELELEGSSAVTVTTIGDDTYALIAAYDDDGVQIIDISDPANPIAIASLDDDTETSLGGVTDITTTTIGNGIYALVVAQDESGLQIIDISDPSNPEAVGSLTDSASTALDGATSVATIAKGDKTYALITALNDNGLQIVDITRPTNPKAIVSLTDTADTTLNGAYGITTARIGAKDYALVIASTDNSLQVIEITEPTTPRAIASLTDDHRTEFDNPRDVVTISIGANTYALITSFDDDGVQIVDVGNPARPVAVISQTDTALTALDGAFRITTATFDDKTYVLVAALSDNGIQIVEINDSIISTKIASLSDTTGTVLKDPVAITTANIDGNTYALVAAFNEDGIQIIDISDPTNPFPVSTLTDTGQTVLDGPSGIATIVIDNKSYALVSSQLDNGIQVIDISDPASPTPVGSLTDTGRTALDSATGIATTTIGGSAYAIVAAFDDDGVQIIDISNPAEPTAVLGGSLTNDDDDTVLNGAIAITTTVIEGKTYVLVAATTDDSPIHAIDGIQIIEITNPSMPVAIAALTDEVIDGLDGSIIPETS